MTRLLACLLITAILWTLAAVALWSMANTLLQEAVAQAVGSLR